MKTGLVLAVQARLGSSRLPGKVLKEACGKPLLARMLERLARVRTPARLVVLTTTDPADEPIRALCRDLGVDVFRGHPTDLLDRHYLAGLVHGADAIAKIPSDCPLIDPAVIDRVLARFAVGDCDYASNLHPATYPDGNDVEVMSMAVLGQAWREAQLPMEREHTTPFIWERPERFRIANVAWETGLDYSLSQRWTLDYPEDYQFIQQVYEALYPEKPDFGLEDILGLVQRRPELAALNAQYVGVNWYRHHLHELKFQSTPRSGETPRIHVMKPPAFPDIRQSNALWQRAQGLIPAGTQTLAKGPGQYSNGVAPKYAERGQGARLWDVDGNEFLDYQMGIGPIVLGYCHPVVDAAIRRQLEDGITFSLMHPLEVELAELMREVVPNVEAVRFSKTGCDVTSAAVRLARAYTGRERVLCCGYHGWHDWYIAVTDRDAGIPRGVGELTHTFNYNDLDSVIDAIDEGTACVILEPFVFERADSQFLAGLREVCDHHGALLIFDEMWTGFRCAPGGAQEFLGVRADLCLFSKAMANGMPISAIAGRADVMALFEKDVFFFTTFGGEALSLAAAQACIEFIYEHEVTDYLAQTGQSLLDGVNGLIQQRGLDYVSMAGYPFRTLMNFSPAAGNPLLMKTLVQQELIRRGILWSGTFNLCYAHTEADVALTLAALDEAFQVLADAVDAGDLGNRLRGEPLQPVFRKTSQFHVKPRRAEQVPV